MKTTTLRVVLTGASRGLGRALALELARRGARLVLIARGNEALEAVAQQARSLGAEAHVLAADLGDKQAIHPLAGTALALLGGVDLLVHNASVLGPTPLRSLLDTDCEALEHVLAVNLVGPFRLTKALLPSMLLEGRGTVLVLSSDAAVSAYPQWGAYGVSKAALDHLTRIWAQEVSNSEVRFLAVDPGEMDTVMHQDALPEADRSLLASPETVAKQLLALLDAPSVRSGDRRLASEGVR